MKREIVVEETIDASATDIWKAWTTTEGIESWLAGKADIELSIGGKYEIYFDPDAPAGSRGSEDCRVLSYSPREMLSFSWNAPPSIPKLRDAGVKTWVVVNIEPTSDSQTKLTITHLGIKDGPDWDAYLAYFEAAWPNVAKACKEHFASDTTEK